MTDDLTQISQGAYDALHDSFEWDVPDTVNAAVELCDRHVSGGTPALAWENATGTTRTFTFASLQSRSEQCAAAFRDLGVQRGDTVALFLPNDPEFLIALLACHRLGAVCMPLYHLFGPDALSHRLTEAEPTVLVTDADGLAKLSDVPSVPDEVVLIDEADDSSTPFEPKAFDAILASASGSVSPADTAPTDPAMLFYTSGTTGEPKGVVHGHQYVLAHRHVGKYGRDVTAGDRVWHTGNLAWAGGYSNLAAVWSNGASMLKYKGRFDPAQTIALLESYEIDLFATAPTAIRRLMDLDDPLQNHDVDLRAVVLGGERVTVDILEWVEDTLDAFAINLWGQTETYALGEQPLGEERPAKLGSLGKPLPGFDATVLDGDGDELPAGEVGELAIRADDNPAMFIEYFEDPEQTAAVRKDGWYLTEDAVYRDADGYFWFQGRQDDIIISSGYKLSPAQIEAAITSHPAVGEAAVIGVPDAERTNIARGYVELSPGNQPSEDLAEEIQTFVKSQLARHEYPHEIAFRDELPTTLTGKIERDTLRAEALDEDGR